jgi:hypothetical protein
MECDCDYYPPFCSIICCWSARSWANEDAQDAAKSSAAIFDHPTSYRCVMPTVITFAWKLPSAEVSRLDLATSLFLQSGFYIYGGRLPLLKCSTVVAYSAPPSPRISAHLDNSLSRLSGSSRLYSTLYSHLLFISETAATDRNIVRGNEPLREKLFPRGAFPTILWSAGGRVPSDWAVAHQ